MRQTVVKKKGEKYLKVGVVPTMQNGMKSGVATGVNALAALFAKFYTIFLQLNGKKFCKKILYQNIEGFILELSHEQHLGCVQSFLCFVASLVHLVR